VQKCMGCGAGALTEINTYKRKWYFCHECGTACPIQKYKYSLTFLPNRLMKKSGESEDVMYDYFIESGHIEYSIGTAHDFLKQHIDPNGIKLDGQSILDISGGNGHFIMEIAKRGATVALTEINKPTLDYARKTHGIDVYEFNFNHHHIHETVTKSYDMIFARAAIMFCKDLGAFARDCRNILPDGGLVSINHSVIPTLGVMIRVQLDEFSYWVLRQPEEVIRIFAEAGYALQSRADETDPSMYVYDHDMVRDWQIAHFRYQIPAVRKIWKAEKVGRKCFTLRARDRRRSTMFFKKLP
jgi:2-polyprenyl-3-methyl-5-hydroxy-6-metoxy-1,4-benzoquinol methylase